MTQPDKLKGNSVATSSQSAAREGHIKGPAAAPVLIIRAGDFDRARHGSERRALKSTILDLEGAFFARHRLPILDRP